MTTTALKTKVALKNTNSKKTDRILFNVPTKLKIAAKKRAIKEGVSLTDVLTAIIRLYVDGQIALDRPELRATPESIARFNKIKKNIGNERSAFLYTTPKKLSDWIEE